MVFMRGLYLSKGALFDEEITNKQLLGSSISGEKQLQNPHL
jgi:hypothetical protein